MKNQYQELRDRQQEEVNAFPLFFAFDKQQFAEGMSRLGLRPSDMNQVYAIAGISGFYRKSDAPRLHEMFARHRKELEEAIAADKAGDLFSAITVTSCNCCTILYTESGLPIADCCVNAGKQMKNTAA